MATAKKKIETKSGGALGAGLAVAAVAAAAGAYFLYGKDGSKNRKKIKGWMLKAKGEILEQVENGKEMSEEAYNKVIDKVSQKYQAAKNIDRAELDQMVKELRGHWKSITKQLAAKPKKKNK